MGADLYLEPIHSENRESLDPVWDDAIKRRNALKEGTPEYKAAQEEVDRLWDLLCSPEFYFRDSYNAFCMLNAFGLSWWKDVIPLRAKSGRLTKEGAKKFVALLEKHRELEVGPDSTHDLGSSGVRSIWEYAQGDDGKPVSKDNWEPIAKYFYERRDQLLRFLKAYINCDKKGVHIVASL